MKLALSHITLITLLVIPLAADDNPANNISSDLSELEDGMKQHDLKNKDNDDMTTTTTIHYHHHQQQQHDGHHNGHHDDVNNIEIGINKDNLYDHNDISSNNLIQHDDDNHNHEQQQQQQQQQQQHQQQYDLEIHDIDEQQQQQLVQSSNANVKTMDDSENDTHHHHHHQNKNKNKNNYESTQKQQHHPQHIQNNEQSEKKNHNIIIDSIDDSSNNNDQHNDINVVNNANTTQIPSTSTTTTPTDETIILQDDNNHIDLTSSSDDSDSSFDTTNNTSYSEDTSTSTSSSDDEDKIASETLHDDSLASIPPRIPQELLALSDQIEDDDNNIITEQEKDDGSTADDTNIDTTETDTINKDDDNIDTDSDSIDKSEVSTTNENEESDEGGDNTEAEEEQQPVEQEEKIVSVDHANKSSGALILEKSPNFEGTSNLLSNHRDEYAMVPCNVEGTKFVIVGLSEDILIKKIKLSSFERYSSTTKKFQVLGSQTYPISTEWEDLGTYEAKPWFKENKEQTFVLKEPSWARYLKFRLLSHYGDEHYCTLTQIQVHGSTTLQGYHEMQIKLAEEEQVVDEEVKPIESDQKPNQIQQNNQQEENVIQEQQSQQVQDQGPQDNQQQERQDQQEQPVQLEQQETKPQEQPNSDGASKSTEDISIDSDKEDLVETNNSNIKNESEEKQDSTSGYSHTDETTSEVITSHDKEVNGDEPATTTVESSEPDENVEIEISKEIIHDKENVDNVEESQVSLDDNIQTKDMDENKIKLDINGSKNESSEDAPAKDDGKITLVDDTKPSNSETAVVTATQETEESIATAKVVSEDDTTDVKVSDIISEEETKKLDDDSITSKTEEISDDAVEKVIPESDGVEKIDEPKDVTPHTTEVSVKDSMKSPDVIVPDKVVEESQTTPNDDSAMNNPTASPHVDVHDLKRFPNASCLEGLDFNQYKANHLKTASVRTNTNTGGLPPIPKNQPIFKELTDEIKVLKSNQVLYEQYIKEVTSCYHQVVSGMVSEIDHLETDRINRILKIEATLEDMILSRGQSKETTGEESKEIILSYSRTLSSSLMYISWFLRKLFVRAHSAYFIILDILSRIWNDERVQMIISLLHKYDREFKSFLAGIFTCIFFLHFQLQRRRPVKKKQKGKETIVEALISEIDHCEPDIIDDTSSTTSSKPTNQNKILENDSDCITQVDPSISRVVSYTHDN